MNMKYLLPLLFVSASCFAQEAKIMIVEKSDSQKLAQSYREYKDALKQWESTKAEVAKHYTSEHGKTLEGWEKIQFSADFRAIVPDSSQYASRYPSCGWGFTTTSAPAITTTGNGTNAILSMSDGDLRWSSTDGVASDLTVKEKR